MRKLGFGIAATLVLCAVAVAQPLTQSVFATQTGIIQGTGPRPPTGGDDFFNVEGAANGSFADYGVSRWDLTAAKAAFDLAFGAGLWTVARVDVIYTQSNAGFTTNGDLLVYHSSDDVTDIKTVASPLAYPLFAPGPGPDIALDPCNPVALHTFVEVITGHKDSINLFNFGDGGTRGALASDIEADTGLTLVLVEDPNEPTLAATWMGQTGRGTPTNAPELQITAILAGANAPPIANAGPDQTVVDADFTLAELVTLDGSGSTDFDGTIVSYVWTENAVTIATGVSPTVSLSLGTHTITLTVTDDGTPPAQDTDVVVVDVVPGAPPPVANAGAEQEKNDAGAGTANFTLDGSGSTDASRPIVNYEWSERGTIIASGPTPTAATTLACGMHTIRLSVTNDAGAVGRDVVFLKVLPPAGTILARHDFDLHTDATRLQSPLPGTFTSAGDSFEIRQRGVSPTIPFAALDDTGSRDPNGESCGVFPADTGGVVMCAKQDAFFACVDLRNATNPLCDKGRVTFTYSITGADPALGIEVWIDMGASGDFEARGPNDPNEIACDPNDFTTTPLDAYDWTYKIDAGPWNPLFTASVNEAGSRANVFFSGKTVILQDPMRMITDPLDPNRYVLDNEMLTVKSEPISVANAAFTLKLRMKGRGDSGSEGYVFDDMIITDAPAACGPGCNVAGGDADVNDDCAVNLTDLAIILANFGVGPGASHAQGDTNGDGFVNLNDLANVLALFGTACP